MEIYFVAEGKKKTQKKKHSQCELCKVKDSFCENHKDNDFYCKMNFSTMKISKKKKKTVYDMDHLDYLAKT